MDTNKKRNRVRQVLAMIGIVLLAALYIVTLVLAIIGTEDTTPWFMGCICATILVPILIWVILWFYDRLRKDVSGEEESSFHVPGDPFKK